VGTRTTARGRTGLNHVLHGELPCDLGKMLSGCLGSKDQWRGEFGGGGPAAAAGARAPVIVWLGLINKRFGELLECTRKSLGARGSWSFGWRGKHTSGAYDGDGGGSGGCVCARGTAGAGL
jgi:hypothetical protein